MELAGKRVIKYNEQIVEIKKLTDLLGFDENKKVEKHKEEETLLLLTEVHQQLQAYELSQVVDLIEIDSEDIMPSIAQSKHILGHYVEGDRVYNLISLRGKAKPQQESAAAPEELKQASGSSWGLF